MAIDNKVEKAYFDLTFHREETGQEKSMGLLTQATLLRLSHPSAVNCRHEHRVVAFSF